MGRNREVIEARTQHWVSVAEEYAKSKFNGENPEHISIALILFSHSPYDYYQVLAALGEREAIYVQIDEDIQDLSKCIAIIQKLAAMMNQNNWDRNDLEDALSFLFSGNSFILNVFETELNTSKTEEDVFTERVDFIQDISQYIQDPPVVSDEVREQDE